MKMKYIWNSLMLTLMLFISTVSMLAQEQDSEQDHRYIIREDRVWEYVRETTNTTLDWEVLDYVRVRFNGVTKINGLEYSNLVYDGGKRVTYTYYDTATGTPHFDAPLENTEILEAPDWLPCLMREDNGKVYTYSERSAQEYKEHGEDYFGDLTHDFTLKPDDSFMPILYWNGHIEQGGRYEATLSVTDVRSRTINNEECREIRFIPDDISDTYWKNGYDTADLRLIEGIGFVEVFANYATGTIAHIGAACFPTGGTCEDSYGLNNIYDLKGNVIYTGIDRKYPVGINEFSSELFNNPQPLYYNLQGMPIEKPESGIYIERRNGRSLKHLK